MVHQMKHRIEGRDDSIEMSEVQEEQLEEKLFMLAQGS